MSDPHPTIFDRRSARSAFELSRDHIPTITVPVRPNTTATVKSAAPGRSRRSTVTGFLPLPPISASPVCTPTTSTSREFGFGSDCSISNESCNTAPSSPPSLRPSPKWISTPPTPPPKLFRRSVTCLTRRPLSSFPPSASFPTSMAPHASDRFMQRRNSVPAMSSSPRPSSDLYPHVGRRRTKLRRKATNPTTSPLSSTFIAPKEPMHYFARPRPLFDVAHEVAMDYEDRTVTASVLKPVVSQEKIKDDVRKYHALMELLSTEVSYMQDLRVLVSIYLRQIPTLTLKRSSSSSSTFSRNSSFSALSRASSSAHLSNGSGISSQLQPLTSLTSTKEREKSPVRHIFKDSEVDVLTRNAEEVLQFHENFVEELRTAMTPFGFRMDLSSERPSDEEIPEASTENIDEGIAIVSTKFATEASRFTSYEMFCAGHPEAMDIVRRVQNAHPTEWEAFEQKCGASVFEMLNGHTSSDDNPPAATAENKTKPKPRRNSTASIDGAVRYVRSRSNSLAKDRDLPAENSRNRSRLNFMDYLIKPVQRICKYPLLLDQLKMGQALLGSSELRALGRWDGNVVVESAAQAMRHVASAVDEARRKQDIVVRSSLIASRMVYPHVMPSSSHAMLQFLTPSFVSSLGACHLAGSLDVIHQRSSKPPTGTANINVKYLGAFLYLGGYFILAKVIKGKTYEPRHWFRLCDFKIDDAESEAWLPCSFRITCKGHEFELAAACQQEKEVWLTAIRESLAYPMSNWINEPIANVDGKGPSKGDSMPAAEMIPSTLDGPFEVIAPLSTINSVPDMAEEEPGDGFAETLLNALVSDSPSKSSSKEFGPPSPEAPSAPSRRSSSTSAKANFIPATPEYETFIIRRNLPSARTQIDVGLHDVISAACLSARSQAASQEEELFQPPNTSRQGSPNRPTPSSKLPSRASTNSGLNRLRKHESVRVPRRKSLIQIDDPLPADHASRARSLVARKRPKKLSLKTNNSDGGDRMSNFFLPPDSFQFQSPPTSFSCSSASTVPSSNPPSTRASPTLEVPAYNGARTRAPRSEPDHSRSRPVSFVGSVRSLFISRPPSPTRGPTLTTMDFHASDEQKQPKPGNVFKRWARGSSSRHRRTLSAPDASNEQSGQGSDDSPILPDVLGFGEPLKLMQSPVPM